MPIQAGHTRLSPASNRRHEVTLLRLWWWFVVASIVSLFGCSWTPSANGLPFGPATTTSSPRSSSKATTSSAIKAPSVMSSAPYTSSSTPLSQATGTAVISISKGPVTDASSSASSPIIIVPFSNAVATGTVGVSTATNPIVIISEPATTSSSHESSWAPSTSSASDSASATLTSSGTSAASISLSTLLPISDPTVLVAGSSDRNTDASGTNLQTQVSDITLGEGTLFTTAMPSPSATSAEPDSIGATHADPTIASSIAMIVSSDSKASQIGSSSISIAELTSSILAPFSASASPEAQTTDSISSTFTTATVGVDSFSADSGAAQTSTDYTFSTGSLSVDLASASIQSLSNEPDTSTADTNVASGSTSTVQRSSTEYTTESSGTTGSSVGTGEFGTLTSSAFNEATGTSTSSLDSPTFQTDSLTAALSSAVVSEDSTLLSSGTDLSAYQTSGPAPSFDSGASVTLTTVVSVESPTIVVLSATSLLDSISDITSAHSSAGEGASTNALSTSFDSEGTDIATVTTTTSISQEPGGAGLGSVRLLLDSEVSIPTLSTDSNTASVSPFTSLAELSTAASTSMISEQAVTDVLGKSDSISVSESVSSEAFLIAATSTVSGPSSITTTSTEVPAASSNPPFASFSVSVPQDLSPSESDSWTSSGLEASSMGGPTLVPDVTAQPSPETQPIVTSSDSNTDLSDTGGLGAPSPTTSAFADASTDLLSAPPSASTVESAIVLPTATTLSVAPNDPTDVTTVLGETTKTFGATTFLTPEDSPSASPGSSSTTPWSVISVPISGQSNFSGTTPNGFLGGDPAPSASAESTAVPSPGDGTFSNITDSDLPLTPTPTSSESADETDTESPSEASPKKTPEPPADPPPIQLLYRLLFRRSSNLSRRNMAGSCSSCDNGATALYAASSNPTFYSFPYNMAFTTNILGHGIGVLQPEVTGDVVAYWNISPTYGGDWYWRSNSAQADSASIWYTGLKMHDDGVLRMWARYSSGWVLVWQPTIRSVPSEDGGNFCAVLQDDGNFVVYAPSCTVFWAFW